MEVVVRPQRYKDGERVGGKIALYCRGCGVLMLVSDSRDAHCHDCFTSAIIGTRRYFFEIPTVYYYSPRVQAEERHFVHSEEEFNSLKKVLKGKYGIEHLGGQD